MSTNLQKALKAAKKGPEVKDLRIKGHDFNVKKYGHPYRIPTIIKGQLSHVKGGVRDDQIFYLITFRGKSIALIQTNIKERGWSEFAGPIGSALGAFLLGIPIPEDELTVVLRKIENAVDGTWQSAADYLIANIAVDARPRA